MGKTKRHGNRRRQPSSDINRKRKPPIRPKKPRVAVKRPDPVPPDTSINYQQCVICRYPKVWPGYKHCRECNRYPDRIPGVCANCGRHCHRWKALCNTCYYRYANITIVPHKEV